MAGHGEYGDTTRLQSCVDRWLGGDDSARDELLVRSQERLRRLARKMLKGFAGVQRAVETDDVLMEANRRLIRALTAVQPKSVDEFIGLAALNIRWQLLDWARKYRHERVAPNGSSLPIEPADSSTGPATLARWSEFHELIGRLDPERRKRFDLLYYGGLTLPEAAAALGVSLATLKIRWMEDRLFVVDALKK